MSTLQSFFLLVGAFLAAFAIFVLLVFVWIRHKLRTWLKRMQEAVGKYAALAPMVPPFRIRLQRADEPDWHRQGEIEELSRALEEVGFQTIGDFRADETPGLTMRALTDPDRRLYAVIYDHPQIAPWFDLVCRYADDRTHTFTTAPPSGLAKPPFLVLEHHPGAEPQELLEHCLATRPPGELLPTPAADFVRIFEAAHAREMDWRAERGGPSEAEIRAIAGKDGSEVETELIESVRSMWRSQANEHWREQLRTAYLNQAGLSARRWEEVRDRLVFVHDRLSADDLLATCEEALVDDIEVPGDDGEGDDDDDRFEQELERRRSRLREAMQGLPSRAAFSKINESLPKKFQHEKIGELAQPLPADVYLRPPWEDD